MNQVQSSSIPHLHGLVLAGGDSSRMGFDKSTIDYHGKPQREHLIDLLGPFVTHRYISCRPGQIIDGAIPILEDVYTDLGPFSAVLSAFRFNAECAWLVVACDFPLLDASSIRQLIVERDVSAIATSFLDEKSQLPEPWITILEPKIHSLLLEYLHQGRSSLRGVLIDHHAKCIRPVNPDILLNANTKEEAEALRLKIKH